MAIVLDDKTVAVWVLPMGGDDDLLASIREVRRNKRYELTYRFRREMERTWYKGRLDGNRAEALESAEAALNVLAAKVGRQLYTILG